MPSHKYNALKFRYYLYLKNRKKADLINKRWKLLARLLFDTSLDVIYDAVVVVKKEMEACQTWATWMGIFTIWCIEKISYRSIAYEEVQTLRDRIYIWDFSRQKYRSLHSYVPFYFATRTPMLHNKYTEGIQDQIAIFEVSRVLLKDQGVLFSDGNISNQQLSKYRGERVDITPITVSGGECIRKYQPGGPYGTNISRSNCYSGVTFLEHLDWDGINNRRHIDPLEEYIRIRHAEVLVPDLLPLGRVEGIVVRTRDMVQAVNALLEECGLIGRIPSAVRKPQLFF